MQESIVQFGGDNGSSAAPSWIGKSNNNMPSENTPEMSINGITSSDNGKRTIWHHNNNHDTRFKGRKTSSTTLMFSSRKMPGGESSSFYYHRRNRSTNGTTTTNNNNMISNLLLLLKQQLQRHCWRKKSVFKLPWFVILLLGSFYLCIRFLSTNNGSITSTTSSNTILLSTMRNTTTTTTTSNSITTPQQQIPSSSSSSFLRSKNSNDQVPSTNGVSTTMINNPKKKGYTVLLRPKNCHRINLIQQSIDHYSTCPNVKQIQIFCNYDNENLFLSNVIRSNTYYHQQHPTNVLVFHNTSSFIHTLSTATTTSTKGGGEDEEEAMLLALVEDSFLISCSDIHNAYTIWHQHKDRMVGFFAYSVRHQEHNQGSHIANNSSNLTIANTIPLLEKEKEEQPLPIAIIEETSKVGMSYSIVSDQIAFVQKSYIVGMQRQDQEKLLFPSTITNPCRHLALSIQITSITGKPPLRVFCANRQSTARLSDPYRKFMQKKKMVTTKNSQQHREYNTCVQTLLQTYRIQELPLEPWTYAASIS